MGNAARLWMGGDIDALKDGEARCKTAAEHWLTWLEAQTCEVIPAIRFDFFVGRSAVPGKADVWTLEICELGFSMLAHEELPGKVFAAMLRSCLDMHNDGHDDEAGAKRRRIVQASDAVDG